MAREGNASAKIPFIRADMTDTAEAQRAGRNRTARKTEGWKVRIDGGEEGGISAGYEKVPRQKLGAESTLNSPRLTTTIIRAPPNLPNFRTATVG